MVQMPSGAATVHILGAGAQGLIFYTYAEMAGLNWVLLLRPGSVAPTQMNYQYAGIQRALTLHAECSDQVGEVNCVLVCVKTFQLQDALLQIQPHLGKTAVILLCQNGVEALAQASIILPKHTLIPVCSTHGSYRSAPFAVVDSGNDGQFILGPGQQTPAVTERLRLLTNLNKSGLKFAWDEQITARLWRKLAVNACINPLTTLCNCRNGELLQHPLAQAYLPELVQEIATIVSDAGTPLTAVELLEQVSHVCQLTAANFSSMHQDWWQHKPTEKAAILGSLLNHAQKAHLPAAKLQDLDRQLAVEWRAD